MTGEDQKMRPSVLVGRLATTARNLWRRVLAGPLPDAQPAWTERMTVVAVVAWLGIVLVHPFDAEAIRAVAHSRFPPLVFLRDITNVGRSTAYLVTAFIVMAAASFVDWRGLRRRVRGRIALVYGQATFAFAAIALSGLAANLVKLVVGRARPKFLDLYGPDYREAFHAGYDFASFPSGHSTTMGAIAAILALWFPRWRLPIGAVAFVLACSRTAAGAHYPSDVLGGFVFGFLFTAFLARLLARRNAGFRFASSGILPQLRFRRL